MAKRNTAGLPNPASPNPPGAWIPFRNRVQRILAPVERFLAIEAASGIVLMAAAVAALVWANSPWKAAYVVDAGTGKIVATIKNGTRVDALAWDPGKKLVYIPNGGEGNVTVVHQDSADKYTVVATVDTFPGAKTITVDTKTHNVYLFQPERGPAPPAPAGAAEKGGRGRGPQGPVIASWFIVIKPATS